MIYIFLLLLFVIPNTSMSQEFSKIDNIVRYDGTNGCAYEIMKLDIGDVETIYIPMRNGNWTTERDELLSREPAKREELIILAKKSCIFNPVLPNQIERKGIGNIDENQKKLWCGYLKSEDGKELYVAKFFKDKYGDLMSADGGYYIDLEVQKPDNVKIKFYQKLYETPFLQHRLRIREKEQSDNNEDIWTRIEGVPTTLRRLAGIKTEEEKIKEYPIENTYTLTKEKEPTIGTDKEVNEQLLEFWLNDGIDECIRQRKRAFEISIEEHNYKVEKIRIFEATPDSQKL